MFLRFALLTLLALFVWAGQARADDYIKPTWADLTRTLVRFNAIDLSDPAIFDEYAIITECDLYTAFYHDDFKWNKVRQAVLSSTKDNIATFPTNYQYDTKLQLDRYDFAAKLFRFTDKATVHNVNSFMIYDVQGTGCGTAAVKILPRTFRAVLPDLIDMPGIPLAEADAKALLDQMNKNGNTSRIVYARFNLRITYIEPLRKTADTVSGSADSSKKIYRQSNAGSANGVRLDARLSSVDFYEDPQMQILIYEMQF